MVGDVGRGELGCGVWRLSGLVIVERGEEGALLKLPWAVVAGLVAAPLTCRGRIHSPHLGDSPRDIASLQRRR